MKHHPLARPLPRLAAFIWSFLALISTLPCLQAQFLLTNGHPVHVKLPAVDKERTVIADEKGFQIFVPPGAETLEITFTTTPGAQLEVLARANLDVGIPDADGFIADFRGSPDGNGVATIVVSSTSGRPRLESAIYHIGFQIRVTGVAYEGTLQATVEGLVLDPVRLIQRSEFDTDLDGWTSNNTPSDIPGTNVGDRDSFVAFRTTGGNPGGYVRLTSFGFFGPKEWFVAPDKFLVDLLEFEDTRFEFDIQRIYGEIVPANDIQMRVFGSDTVFLWIGTRPPEVGSGWETFSASIRPDLWTRIEGSASFQAVFSNPSRIEVRGNYTIGGEAVGLDNFKILGRGDVPPLPVLPMISAFSGGLDGWARNHPEERRISGSTIGDAGSLLVWGDPEGNPGGFLRLVENGGENPDAFVASSNFLGDTSALSNPRIEFDYHHQSAEGATRPVQIRLFSDTAIFLWTGAVPGNIWGRQIAPLTASVWERVSGDAGFLDTLARIVRIEISADQAEGPEWNSLDNFAIFTDDSPAIPPVLSANPSALDFPGVATGPNPPAQIMQVTSSGPRLRWNASVSGALADRVTLSSSSGDTPAIVSVQIDTQGLPSGLHQAVVTFTAVGVNIETSEVVLNLNLGPQPNPTPFLNEGGVVHSATNLPGLSPGALGTAYGRDLTGSVGTMQTSFGGRTGDVLPRQVQGVRVLVLDAAGALIAEAPLLYISNTQINFQMPFEVFGLPEVQIVVDNNGARSEPRSVGITAAAPGIFLAGDNRALAVNANGSVNSSSNAAARGSVLVVYLSGQGAVAPTWPTGKAASAFPLVRAPSEASVRIGGVVAQIQFLGLAPGMVGVTQLNVTVPEGAPAGNQPLSVTIAGFSSNEPLVSIQ